MTSPEAGSPGLVKSPQDFAGGLFLIALAALGFAGGFNLPTGTLSGIGSGLLPKSVAALIAAFGVLLVVFGLLFEGDRMEEWHVRAPVFVLGAVAVFAMLIRGSTLNFGGVLGIPLLASVNVPGLGLIVAGPLSVIIASLAEKSTRPVEILIFAVVMTVLSGILFKEMLNLPIPFDPAGLVPSWINNTYVATKLAIGHAIVDIKNLFVR